jgi:hypothetical protein
MSDKEEDIGKPVTVARKIASHSKGKKSSASYSFEFNPITFPSLGPDVFRVTVKSVDNVVLLWLECKKTKQQWQATVKDISDTGPAGPVGLPEEVVYQSMKRAFELAMVSDEKCTIDRDDPVVDFVLEDGEATLVLTLSLMKGIWKPEFNFAMLPIGLDKIDVLEAQLRDAQDEIESMRAQLRDIDKSSSSAFICLSSALACAFGQIVVWNQNKTVREIPATHFCLSTDMKQVVIKKAGVYQVHVRLAGTNNANTAHLGLQLNGAEFAQCTQSSADSHQNTPQITELMELNVADVLQVRCGANSNSLTVAFANRFSIVYIGK